MGQGQIFGPKQIINLTLLETTKKMPLLDGLVAEIKDGGFPIFAKIIGTDDPDIAFKQADVIILAGAKPPLPKYFKANVRIFHQYGLSLNRVASSTTKVLVVTAPATILSWICLKFATQIPSRNFTGLSRLDQNRAQAELAAHLKIGVGLVQNVYVWGCPWKAPYPDLRNATATVEGKKKFVRDLLQDDYFLKGEFIRMIHKRGIGVLENKKISAAMAGARAAGQHLKDLWLGTNNYSSMVVCSDGSYGVPEGVMFSFPVVVKNKQWEIVKGLEIDDFSRAKFEVCVAKLMEAREEALKFCPINV